MLPFKIFSQMIVGELYIEAAYVTAAVELICLAVFSSNSVCACVVGVFIPQSTLISDFLVRVATPFFVELFSDVMAYFFLRCPLVAS